MCPVLRTPIAALVVIGLTCAVRAQDATADDASWRLRWKDGLRLDSADGLFRIRLNGRLTYEVAESDGGLEESTGGSFPEGGEWRQRRLALNGWVGEDWRFQTMWGYEEGTQAESTQIQTWVQWTGGSVDAVKAGHYREPFGLESQVSITQLQLLERSLPTQAFGPGRNTGVGVRHAFADGLAHVTVGAYKETDDAFDDLGGDTQLTARFTAAPIDEDEGRELVHAGFSISRRSDDDGSVRFDTRPETHRGDELVDTGPLAADDVDLYGLEFAWHDGPLSTQAEWMLADVDRIGASDNEFRGWYGEVGYFLTGEHRRYDRSQGHPLDPHLSTEWERPREFVQPDAVQIVGRYSYIDLDDGDVAGGKERNTTLGLNWYLNSYVRLATNWIHVDVSGEASADVLVMRLQVTF